MYSRSILYGPAIHIPAIPESKLSTLAARRVPWLNFLTNARNIKSIAR